MQDEIITVLLVAMERDLGKAVAERLETEEEVALVGIVEDPTEAVQYAVSLAPDAVLIIASADEPWQDLCGFIDLACSGSRAILLTDRVDTATVEAAMMVGVRQVLPCPDGMSVLPSTLLRLRALDEMRTSEEFVRATDPTKFTRMIALSGAKGGVGKTTLTANLGVALAEKGVGGVVVLDAYSQFGDLANVMGISPTRVLTDLVEMGEDIDDNLVFEHILHHDSGADVLLTADKPTPMNAVNEMLAERVITALRHKYRFIIADSPPMLCPLSAAIINRSWRLLVVTTLKDVTAMTDAMKFVNMLDAHRVRGESICVVANRVSKADSVDPAKAESLFGKRVIAAIPEDPQVSQANNLGVPICRSHRGNPVSRGIRALADKLADEASTFQPLGERQST